MNTCRHCPGKYAPCRDGDGGYICRACWQKQVRQRQRERRMGKPGIGLCLCGEAAVVVIKTLHGKMKLCERCEQLEKLQAALVY